MMKILITGGAGFIGRHLCAKFLEKDFSVYCVDNFITSSIENIKDFLKDKNFKLIKKNASSPFKLKEKFNWIMHFASLASPKAYLEKPIETLKVSLFGTYYTLELAKKLKAKYFFASTSEIYGDPKEHPQKEDYWGNVNPIGKRACYDESKRAGEALVYSYYRKFNLEVRVVRIFNTYGPYMKIDDGRVVSNFIVEALLGKPLTIYGDGTQTRSFCYIDDLITGLLKMMEVNYFWPINLGNPYEITIKELADLVLKLVPHPKKEKIKYLSLPENDPIRRCPDISKAKKYLKWQPKISLEEGLKKTIDYFKKVLKKE